MISKYGLCIGEGWKKSLVTTVIMFFIIATLHGSSIFEYQGKNWPEEGKQESPQGQRPAQGSAEERRRQTELSPRP